jgi:hypothetical protein
MEDAPFIVVSWVLSFGSVALFAKWTLSNARRHGGHLADEELPWR